MMTSIQRTWIQTISTSDYRWGKKARLELHQQWLHGQIDADAFVMQVHEHLQQDPADRPPLEHMHQAMKKLSTSLHTHSSSQTTHPIAGPCARFHHHTRCLRSHSDVMMLLCYLFFRVGIMQYIEIVPDNK